jgi:uncharacterized protein (DUF1501 family)
MIKRRDFLKTAGLCTLSYLCPNLSGWAAGYQQSEPNGTRLIVIFLRGAVDGLNVVAPYGDSLYYSLRPSVSIARPGQELGLLDLDGHFGLNPALEPLLEHWKNGSLAIVQATGSPDPTRSHFDAQDFMESGTPGVKVTSSGWMNRLLMQLPNSKSPVRAVNVGEVLPRILQGPASIASYAPAGRFAAVRKPLDYPVVAQYFGSMYGSRTDSLGKAFNEGMSAHKTLKKDLEGEMTAANQGAPDARNFKGFGSQIGRLFANSPHVQMGFLAIGGWDTHVNQGGSKGQLANKLNTLGAGLAQLVTALGDQYKNTLIVVMSEFGRTVKENGNNGTDHGHGNMMLLLGGGIVGGKVYGNWRGLASGQLYEGRDLPVTTDFRSVLSTVLAEHMKVSKAGMQEVFPGYRPADNELKGIVRG